VRDVLKEGALRTKLEERLREANAQIKAGRREVRVGAADGVGAQAGERMRPYVGDASEVLSHEVARQGGALRGAQGTLLDIDHGTYRTSPLPTRWPATRGGAGWGDGDPLRHRHHQAYTTRVGNGPLVRFAGSHKRSHSWARLLAISFVQYLSGFRANIQAIGEICRRHDCFFLVDAIQGLAHSAGRE